MGSSPNFRLNYPINYPNFDIYPNHIHDLSHKYPFFNPINPTLIPNFHVILPKLSHGTMESNPPAPPILVTHCTSRTWPLSEALINEARRPWHSKTGWWFIIYRMVNG